jgi:dipeptidyl aminopeptidase/acylaminoacyl peptidase
MPRRVDHGNGRCGVGFCRKCHASFAELLRCRTGGYIGSLMGHSNGVDHAVFSPDGKTLITTSSDKTARLWGVHALAGATLLSGHTESVDDVAYSADGKRIVSASKDKTARGWDSVSGAEIVAFDKHRNSVVKAAFDPDGKSVTTVSSDNTARVWDATTGRETANFEEHGVFLRSAGLSGNGRFIIAATQKNVADIWELPTAKKIATLEGVGYPLLRAAVLLRGGRHVEVRNAERAQCVQQGIHHGWRRAHAAGLSRSFDAERIRLGRSQGSSLRLLSRKSLSRPPPWRIQSVDVSRSARRSASSAPPPRFQPARRG